MNRPDATDATDAPLDPISAERLAADGLELRLVDLSDETASSSWMYATERGFLGRVSDAGDVRSSLDGIADRRVTGVYDAKTSDPRVPVATISSWIAELTLPGGRVLPSWAISSVTVAPTHLGRGIARALMEAELRTAAPTVPIAMLTASESQLYGRYGFGAATYGTNWEIDTRRVTWTGPVPAGRLDFITVEEWRAAVPAVHDRARRTRPGEIESWPARWEQIAGLAAKGEDAKGKRAVRYTDESGETRGLLLYTLKGGDGDFTKHDLAIDYVIAETPDSYAAVWRFALQHPLVSTVKAWLLSADEPIRWMFDDMRAARVTEADHQYLRPLDVPAVLSAREYSLSGPVAFELTDPLGFATGTFVIEDGAARVVDRTPEGVPALRLGVRELGTICLGGVATTTLMAAGRLTEVTPGAALAADALLRSERTPYLSLWY